eukprot:gene3638-4972_t
MIVAGGQSRGGWNSLQALDTPGLADVVIAISAATYGTDANAQATRGQSDLHRIFAAAASPKTRVAIIQFKDDPFEQNPTKRFEIARDLLPPRVAALLIIDQPAGLAGHSGGSTLAFAQRYGPCLLRFGIDPVPPAAC